MTALRTQAIAWIWELRLYTAAGLHAPNLAHDIAEVMWTTAGGVRIVRAEDLGGGRA